MKQKVKALIFTDDESCSSKEFGDLEAKIEIIPGLFSDFRKFQNKLCELADDSPVLFISHEYSYPREKLSSLTDFWHLYDKSSFGFTKIAFDRINGCFSTDSHYMLLDSNLTFLLQMFLSCFNSSDLKKLAKDTDELKSFFTTSVCPGIWPTIPDTVSEPWKKIALNHLNNKSLSNDAKAFLSMLDPQEPKILKKRLEYAPKYAKEIYEREVSNRIALQHEELEFYTQQGRLLRTFETFSFYSANLYLAISGKRDLVVCSLVKYFSLAFRTSRPSEEEFLKQIKLAHRINCIADIHKATKNLPKYFLVTKPALINPWARAIVLVGSNEDFQQLVSELSEAAISKRSYRALHRINSVIHDYGSKDVHLNYLQKIQKSDCADILLEHDFIKEIANKYFNEDGTSALPPFDTFFECDQLIASEPLESRLIRACLSQNKSLIKAGLSELFNTNKSIEQALVKLIPYSNELGSIELEINQINLPASTNRRHTFILATLLKDKKYLISDHGLHYGEQIFAVSQSQLHDFTAYNKLISKLTDGANFEPLSFKGKNIVEVFNGFNVSLPKSDKHYGKISVIMTALNPNLELLELSLQSIANQTYKDIELIFIDDGSDYSFKDRLPQIISKYKSSTFFRNEVNSGPYICRNKALELASGDYLAIQDADDFSHPQRFEVQVEALHRQDNAMLVASQHVRIDKYGTIQFEANFQAVGDGTMSSMYKKNVFSEVGCFTAVRSRGDVEMRQRIINKFGSLAYIELDYPLIYCFADSNTLSQNVTRERKGALSVFREAINHAYGSNEPFFKKIPVPTHLRTAAK